ncbi:uncharacterized protein Nmag_1624 [Natrialba magadii ATCC 43099]|uniref:Uncharacterized protein n=1 Tax=Natrialba magadii (strain ATCC 43099 / DSM 3394 / CCM 3739 / CIP 104546 / IAM 13178 / JCM 8861 / NBRC 102185 / NCIMB 2190 / MS3) TaxID=547559 RepID=D3SUE2_NATMM|nr:hypothetical protein [Natrialba magadii]ADD05200.1 uncharacterized protein Nmag_1624 [Natrialba magadii ATCC 43099]ELY23237.1 hypothetical protein C500_20646 [Natrialba magadii ATCC 43099]
METNDTGPTEAVVGQGTSNEEVDIDTEYKGILLTAVVAIAGAFLPWYTILGTSVLGFEGDGVISLIVAALVLAIVWFSDNEKRLMLVGIIGGAIITFVGFYHVTGVSAMGVYVTVFAGLGMLIAGGSGYRKLTN